MKCIMVATLIVSLNCVQGCLSSKKVVVGGDRQMFYPAGSAVPSVAAEDNKEGWYSLDARNMEAIVNP